MPLLNSIWNTYILVKIIPAKVAKCALAQYTQQQDPEMWRNILQRHIMKQHLALN